MNIIKLLIKVFISILSALIGLIVANKYNFFNTLPFVPLESAYDICITVYFTILDLILSWFFEAIKNKLEHIRSSLEVIISLPNTEATINTIPKIKFNSEGIAEMLISVLLNGKNRHFKDLKVKLCDPGSITLQHSQQIQGVFIDDYGDYTIDLNELIGHNSSVNIKRTYRIVMEENIVEGDFEFILKPVINKRNLWLQYKYNQASVKVERR